MIVTYITVTCSRRERVVNVISYGGVVLRIRGEGAAGIQPDDEGLHQVGWDQVVGLVEMGARAQRRAGEI